MIFVLGAVFILLAVIYALRASDTTDIIGVAVLALLGIGIIIADVYGEFKEVFW
jgi:hypothetical protein